MDGLGADECVGAGWLSLATLVATLDRRVASIANGIHHTRRRLRYTLGAGLRTLFAQLLPSYSYMYTYGSPPGTAQLAAGTGGPADHTCLSQVEV